MAEQKPPPQDRLGHEVARRVERRQRAERQAHHSVWSSLGLFGIVGWSVAIPTLLGLGAGVWLDRNVPSRWSWALMLLGIGVAVGCLNAWYWVKQESRGDDGEQGDEQRP